MPIGILKVHHTPSKEPSVIIDTNQRNNFILHVGAVQSSEASSHIGEKVEFVHDLREKHITIIRYLDKDSQ